MKLPPVIDTHRAERVQKGRGETGLGKEKQEPFPLRGGGRERMDAPKFVLMELGEKGGGREGKVRGKEGLGPPYTPLTFI